MAGHVLPDRDLVLRFAARFPLPIGEPGAAHEDQCRAWMLKLQQQLTFSRPNGGYGRKKATKSRPWSKDNLPRLLPGQDLEGWDLMLGAGTGSPVLHVSSKSLALEGQVFETVDPVDHLEDAPTKPPPPEGLTLAHVYGAVVDFRNEFARHFHKLS